MTAKTRCGFIGVGDQGGPIARRMIDAGYPTVLWARRPESLAPYADTNATTAASIAELGAQAEHVGVCVVDDAGVHDVCAQLIPAIREGGCIAIHSTVNPNTCIELAAQAAKRGVALIDAPVSGGGMSAAAGTLTVMVGGEAKAFEAARPVLETFGKLIVHLGGVGAGQNAKLINNTLMAANLGLAYFSVNIGEQLGLDRKALTELVNASSGRSFGFEVYARQPDPSVFKHGAALLAKDMRLLGEAAGMTQSYEGLRDAATPYLTRALAGDKTS